MYITPNMIVAAAGVVTAIIFFIKLFKKAIDWLNKQKKQDGDINSIKKEMTLMCYCMSACLDGLLQLNCNHTVPTAKEKLDKYINQAAHDQEK